MKKLILILLSVLFLILDNTLMPFFAIRTSYPSLLFLFVICYSIINGKWEGIIFGAFAGLLQDLYFGGILGINAFANMLICLIAAEVGGNIFKEKSIIPVIASFFLTALKGIIVFVILYLIGVKSDFEVTLFNSLYTMLLAIFVYRPIYKLTQKSFMKREWKF